MSKKQILIFLVYVNEDSTTFLYTFEKGGQEIIFLEGAKKFSFPPSKVYEKVEMSTTTKLEFGFGVLVLRIRFQYIQWIEQMLPKIIP